mmetsp:Transcript_76878/g.213577  ORF Transcript_76878/g.213577 Transcript_76878/m.213577 type:complete len:759 (-) Transcript_76878:12-2288(-)
MEVGEAALPDQEPSRGPSSARSGRQSIGFGSGWHTPPVRQRSSTNASLQTTSRGTPFATPSRRMSRTSSSGQINGPCACGSTSASTPSSMKRHSVGSAPMAGLQPPQQFLQLQRGRSPPPMTERRSVAVTPALPLDGPKGDISVCVRLRPGPRHEMCIFAESANCVSLRPPDAHTYRESYGREGAETIYWCDYAFGPDATQEAVYNQAIAKICEAVLDGYNGAVIAYGQTGSGKTHTIVGEESNRGVIPRAVNTIFSALEQREAWSVDVCVLEIYNEQVRDLLAPSPGVYQVDIHEVPDSSGGTPNFCCPDATRRNVKSSDDALVALFDGLARREIARTDMNHSSSRSHLIYTLTMSQKDDTLDATLRGRLHLVDLAGSERLKRSMASADADYAEPTPRRRDQRREAGAINKSLTQLALVIYRLTQHENSTLRHVPYRDSMLTRLLADSFGGSSKTCLIITCSALSKDREETRGALEFGKRANLVKNVAQINIEMAQEPSDVVKALVAKEMAEMKRQHEELRRQLRRAAEDAVCQQEQRAREVRAVEEEKASLEQLWLASMTGAAKIHETTASEAVRLREENRALRMQLGSTASELVCVQSEAAMLQRKLEEALVQVRTAEQLAAAAHARAQVVISALPSEPFSQDEEQQFDDPGNALHRCLEELAADVATRAEKRAERLATLAADTKRSRARWQSILSEGEREKGTDSGDEQSTLNDNGSPTGDEEPMTSTSDSWPRSCTVKSGDVRPDVCASNVVL